VPEALADLRRRGRREANDHPVVAGATKAPKDFA
jgi:hypothetical protein